jgi:Dyp-type peroxidase family
MPKEVTSKNIDGITDLVVIAPIKEGFIKAYENVTHATRLKIVAEALNRIRVSAREHEFVAPFSDTTERILTLLDFRIGVIDKDLFSLDKGNRLQSKKYLYLTATFDGAWEPYMRLIWDPLGPFLDLLFCNCEGYVAAGDNSFSDYAAWVRANQMDSGIFYSTTGLTVKDHLYLSKLDRIQRQSDPMVGDLEMARAIVPDPEADAQKVRIAALASATTVDPTPFLKMHELALEALTVLYRLADFYPPEWLFKASGVAPDAQPDEGRYLLRVAQSLLQGWPIATLPPKAKEIYGDPLAWFQTDAAETVSRKRPVADPAYDEHEVQGGILTPFGGIRQGALLLMTVRDADAARKFVELLDLHFEGDGDAPIGGFFRTIAFTQNGLERIGLDPDVLKYFPKEFREGMEQRSGLLGDMRENHPRRWTLPPRNWPPVNGAADGSAGLRPPVAMSEIDFVIQIRSTSADENLLMAEITRLADLAAASGAVLAAYERLATNFIEVDTPTGRKPFAYDHFKFRDGISQPHFIQDAPENLADRTGDKRDDVRLGEILSGYRNDHSDYARSHKPHEKWFDYQFNGSFLVIRKLQQHVETFEAFLKSETARINDKYSITLTEDDLAARLIGRQRNGIPLIKSEDGVHNDFDYKEDVNGSRCPFASHVRRANPRGDFQKRPDPRILRRGMSFDNSVGKDGKRERGLMFMAYGASIAEQFETIQRWINGGNSSGIGSAQNDPLMGVSPKSGKRMFRFEEDGKVIRVDLPQLPDAFVSLHWGLYLFSPSREAIKALCALTGDYRDLLEARENAGIRELHRISSLPEAVARAEWKRLLEDFYAKDPSEVGLSPDVWSAIRWYLGGSFRIDTGISSLLPKKIDLPAELQALPGLLAVMQDIAAASPPFVVVPPPENELGIGSGPLISSLSDSAENPKPVVLTAAEKHIIEVLADWKSFTVEEQLDRFEKSSGAIYVAQQPDNGYRDPALNAKGYNYRDESEATNAVLMSYTKENGFDAGYRAGLKVLSAARRRSVAAGIPYFKLEMRRQFLTPAIGLVCTEWFGLPDWDLFSTTPESSLEAATMLNGGWDWHKATDENAPGGPPLRQPKCPGDCMSPSRYAFYPKPGPTIQMFGQDHGMAIRKAGADYIKKHIAAGTEPRGLLTKEMFKLYEDGTIKSEDVLARNLIGIMLGAIPPMEGSMRGILLEWLLEKTLWRIQADYNRERASGRSSYDAATEALYVPLTRAMCKRPAPDLLYRNATKDTTLKASGYDSAPDTEVKAGDQVIVNLVSASQRSLQRDPTGEGGVSIIFGGKRKYAWQGDVDAAGKPVHPNLPVHACPGRDLALGAMLGISAALLEFGRIEALPASLILKFSDWK